MLFVVPPPQEGGCSRQGPPTKEVALGIWGGEERELDKFCQVQNCRHQSLEGAWNSLICIFLSILPNKHNIIFTFVNKSYFLPWLHFKSIS